MSGMESLAYRAIKSGFRIPASNSLRKVVESSMLIDQLKKLNIDCVLDVGANVGQFAKKLRMMGFQGHIVSFEPITREFERLRQAAQGDKKHHCFNFGLGSTNETKTFNIVGDSSDGLSVFSSFLTPSSQTITNIARENIEVEVKTLDGIFDQILDIVSPSARFFLKLDTQGYDLEVCKGASQSMPCMLGLLSEISIEPLYDGQPHYTEALMFYENLGFSLMDLSTIYRTASGFIGEYDCLMARHDIGGK